MNYYPYPIINNHNRLINDTSLHKQTVCTTNPTIGDVFNVEIGRKYWVVVNCNYMMECDIVYGNNIAYNYNKTYASLGINTPFIPGMIDIFDNKESASHAYRDLYRRYGGNDTTIGSLYLVSIGMKCWAVINSKYYECTIVEGSGVIYNEDCCSITIGIDSPYNCCGIYFNLYHYENEEFARNTAMEWTNELIYEIE